MAFPILNLAYSARQSTVFPAGETQRFRGLEQALLSVKSGLTVFKSTATASLQLEAGSPSITLNNFTFHLDFLFQIGLANLGVCLKLLKIWFYIYNIKYS